MALTSDQAAQYQAWINGGAVGMPPTFAYDTTDALQQSSNAQSAIAAAQGSGLGSMFDLGGTGYGSAYQVGLGSQPSSASNQGPVGTAGSAIAGTPSNYGTAGGLQPDYTGSMGLPTSGASAQGLNPTNFSPFLPGGSGMPSNSYGGSGQSNYGASGGIGGGGLQSFGGGGGMNSYGTTQGGGGAPYNPFGGVTFSPQGQGTGITAGIPGQSGGAAAGNSQPPIGSGAYDALQNLYKQQGLSSTDPNAFNSWAGNVLKQFGVSTWEQLPSNFASTYNANGTSPLPSGSVNNPFGSVPAGVNSTPTTNPDGSRNLGAELGTLGAYSNPFAQQGYNNASQFNPLYTQLNVGNFGNTLNSIAGALPGYYNAANPNIANFNSVLGNTLSGTAANRPTGVGAQTYNPSTATANTGFDPVTGQAVNPSTGFNSVQSPGQDANLQYAQSLLGINGGGSLQQTLQQQAQDGLNLGSSLSSQDQRDAQQSARAAWSARGLVNSPGSVGDEILNQYNLGQQRLQQRQQFAQGVEQQGVTSALGLSNASQGYAGLGLQAQQANLGAQLTGNNLGFQGQLANQGNSLQSQLANQQAQLQTNQLGTANSQFNANAFNQAGQYNTGQTNSMAQFNQNLNFAGNQQNFTNALQYGNYLGTQAINPFSYGLALQGQAPDYTSNLLGYGGDLFNTNFNAAKAAAIARGNNNAALGGAAIGALGGLGGAALSSGLFGGAQGSSYGSTGAFGLPTGSYNGTYSGTPTGGSTYYNGGIIGGGGPGGAPVVLSGSDDYEDPTDPKTYDNYSYYPECIPAGELIETPNGPKAVDEIVYGDTITGYEGKPVVVLKVMRYKESTGTRYYRIKFDNGTTLAVSASHRISGKRAEDITIGSTISGRTVVGIIEFNGVEQSHDIITTDDGYRMAGGVPVNTMVYEMAGRKINELTIA